MGQILIAYCEKCGFKKEKIYFGGGMANHKTVCHVPAIDRNTNQLIVENYYNKENLGDNILFYTEQELFNSKAIEHIGSWKWGDISLKIKENKCPAFNNYSMTFMPTGSFD
jgi:hypothetical protein